MMTAESISQRPVTKNTVAYISSLCLKYICSHKRPDNKNTGETLAICV